MSINISVLFRFLGNEGFKVLVAQNGQQALKIVDLIRPNIRLVKISKKHSSLGRCPATGFWLPAQFWNGGQKQPCPPYHKTPENLCFITYFFLTPMSANVSKKIWLQPSKQLQTIL
jgi:hypothetical protein